MGASSFSVKDLTLYLDNNQYDAGLKNVIFDVSNYYADDSYEFNDILEDFNNLYQDQNSIFNKEYLPSKQALSQVQKELINLYGSRYAYIKGLKECGYDRYYDPESIKNLEEYFDTYYHALEWKNYQYDYNTSDRVLFQPDIGNFEELIFEPLNNLIYDVLEKQGITNHEQRLKIAKQIYKPIIDDLNNQLFKDCDDLYKELDYNYAFSRNEMYYLDNNRGGRETRIKIDDLDQYQEYQQNKGKSNGTKNTR